ncbi:MAG: hypothetical protein AMXMBFR82_25460 [Candidatus Hydrogenedentota bacterium]
MDDLQDLLQGTKRPPIRDLNRDYLDAEVRPLLRSRRAHTLRRRVVFTVGVVILLPVGGFFSPLFLERLPQPVLVKTAQLRNELPRLPIPPMELETIPWPFDKQVEDADVFVQGRIESLDFVQEDLAKKVVALCPPSEHIRTTVRLRVTKSYPEIDAETVTFHTQVSVEGLDNLYMGGDCIVPLAIRDGEYFQPSRAHLFRINPETGRIPGIMDYGRNLTVDEAWKIIRDVYDAVHKYNQVSEETIAKWKEQLHIGTAAQCISAMTYLQTLPYLELSSVELTSAIERLYPGEAEISVEEESQYLHMVQAALESLIPIADSESVEALFKFYVRDRDRQSPVFDRRGPLEDRFIELFLRVPDAGRRERIIKLLGETGEIVDGLNSWQHEYVSDEHALFDVMAKTPGEDIDALFLEIMNDPSAFGVDGIYDLGNLWIAMGRRGMADLRPALEDALAEPGEIARGFANPPEPSHVVDAANRAMGELNRNLPSTESDFELLLASYDAGDTELIHEIRRRFPKDGRPYSYWLKTAPVRDVADLIAHSAPDPSFIPLLTAALDEPVNPPLNLKGTPAYWQDYSERAAMLFALYQCGAREDAVKRVSALLESFPADGEPGKSDEQWHWNFAQFRWRVELLKLAAYFGDEAAYPVVASYLDEESLGLYYGMPPTSGEFEGASNNATRLHAAAIVAAARTGKEQAIPLLQKQFDGERKRVAVVAAMALLYLGDHRGEETLIAWANGEGGFRMPRVSVTGEWEDWPRTVSMESLLRSPEIDAFYLDALRSGKHQFGPQLIVKSGIAEERRSEVLPILVDLLSNRDQLLRGDANEALRRLTGQDFGYNGREVVTHQQDAIAKWRAYVDDLVGGPFEDVTSPAS